MPRPYIASRTSGVLNRRTFDVLVLGGGIAGLTAAIGAARRWRVGLLTKAGFDDTTTFLAQGGIAAAFGPTDSTDLHFQDTVNAGAGLCDEAAVRVLVNEGPERVRELMDICPRFDKVRRSDRARPRRRPLGGARGARRRRRHRQRGLERARRGGPGGQPCGALRERVRHRPAHRGRQVRRRPVAEPRRRRAHARTWPWSPCSPPAAPVRCTGAPPTRAWPPATASPWRTAPAPPSATWSSCSSTPPGSPSRGRRPCC